MDEQRTNHVSTTIDSRQVSAKYYDEAYATNEDLEDLAFYVDTAKANGGPVLELACGTGRILLPIAREGISIHGVDNSRSMLNVLQGKLGQELKYVRELVSTPHGDIRSFRSNRGLSAGQRCGTNDFCAEEELLAFPGSGQGVFCNWNVQAFPLET